MADQADGLISKFVRNKRFLMVQPYIKGKVLDYGCGVGELTHICNPNNYLGVDIDETSIRMANKNHPQFRFAYDVNDNEKFDTIVALAVLEHIAEPVALLKKFKRMLRPDSHILLTVPHPSFYWVHTFFSWIGLLSKHASEDHKQEIDYRHMKELAIKASLTIVNYKRFLFGANQFFLLKLA